MEGESTALSQYISINFCNHWQLSFGIRELIANWNDALFKAHFIDRTDQLKYTKKGTKNIKYTVTLRSGDDIYGEDDIHDKTIFAEIDYNSDKKQLILSNYDTTMKIDSLLDIGNSDKSNQSNAIGKFGEGLKAAAAVIKRNNSNLIYHTNEWCVLFDNENGRITPKQINKCNNKLHNNQNEKNGADGYVVVVVENVAEKDLQFGDYLFFDNVKKIKPMKIVEDSESRLLLGVEYIGKIYYKSIFLCSKKDLPFGINIASTIHNLSRDRNQLNDNAMDIIVKFVINVADSSYDYTDEFIEYMYKNTLTKKKPKRNINGTTVNNNTNHNNNSNSNSNENKHNNENHDPESDTDSDDDIEDYSAKFASHLWKNSNSLNSISAFADRIRDYFASMYRYKTSTNQPIPVPKVQQTFVKNVMNQIKKCGFTSNQLTKVNNALFETLLIAFQGTFESRSKLIINELFRSKQIELDELQKKEVNRLNSIKSYLKEYYYSRLGEIEIKILDIQDLQIPQYNLEYKNLPAILKYSAHFVPKSTNINNNNNSLNNNNCNNSNKNVLYITRGMLNPKHIHARRKERLQIEAESLSEQDFKSVIYERDTSKFYCADKEYCVCLETEISHVINEVKKILQSYMWYALNNHATNKQNQQIKQLQQELQQYTTAHKAKNSHNNNNTSSNNLSNSNMEDDDSDCSSDDDNSRSESPIPIVPDNNNNNNNNNNNKDKNSKNCDNPTTNNEAKEGPSSFNLYNGENFGLSYDSDQEPGKIANNNNVKSATNNTNTNTNSNNDNNNNKDEHNNNNNTNNNNAKTNTSIINSPVCNINCINDACIHIHMTDCPNELIYEGQTKLNTEAQIRDCNNENTIKRLKCEYENKVNELKSSYQNEINKLNETVNKQSIELSDQADELKENRQYAEAMLTKSRKRKFDQPPDNVNSNSNSPA